jgi:thioredoxin reductase
MSERPSPPGDHGVVVVGSGPGGLQTSYWLGRLGVRHTVLSADEGPGGMFRTLPVYQRLLSWTKPDAPVEPGTREYELYDHNSLVAVEPELQALAVQFMDRSFDLPSRPEMEQSLTAFAERAGLAVRYGCRWTGTRREDDHWVLETTDGEYRCRAVVLAVGMAEPWRPEIPGIESVSHYVDAGPPSDYANRRVFIVGKQNSAFEIAQALLPWARQLVLAAPGRVQSDLSALSPLRVRYMQPYDEFVRGGYGTFILDAAIERIDRHGDGYRVTTRDTASQETLVFEVDEVMATTGFRTPLGDLPTLGLATKLSGRLPVLTPFWESVSLPGIFFAGTITQAERGLEKHGVYASSTGVAGYRYNARILAEHLAQRLFGIEIARPPVPTAQAVPYLLEEASRSPELWIQKGYLARVLGADGPGGVTDLGILPLTHFVDDGPADGIALTIEHDPRGTIRPVLYARRRGAVTEHELPPHPLHDYSGDEHRREAADRVKLVLPAAEAAL